MTETDIGEISEWMLVMDETTTGGVLSREQILALIKAEPPLIEDFIDLEAQLQPNGFDLSLETVSRFTGPGTVARDNRDRRLPGIESLAFDHNEQVYLTPGSYLVRFNERVNLPADVMAYARPRSSMLRAGVALHTAVWDAGYSGQGVSLLVIYNPHGFRLQHDARIGQLVFHRLEQPTSDGYQGAYQGESGDRKPDAQPG